MILKCSLNFNVSIEVQLIDLCALVPFVDKYIFRLVRVCIVPALSGGDNSISR